MAYKDYYQILGVARDAGEKEVKKAYRKLATEYHPDKTRGNIAKADKFKEISEAYQVLGNAEKRRQYDSLGEDWELFRQSGSSYEEFMKKRAAYQEQREQYASYGGRGAGDGRPDDYSDIFESFFGGRSGQGYRDPYAFSGADVNGEIAISLQEAYHGTERILELEGNRIKLNVKPGAYDGLQLRARGKGRKGSRGNAGDLYVRVRILPHPLFVRRGDDLYMTAQMDLFDALLGGRLQLATLSGMVNIRVKEGTQNGKTVRLKGKGMPVYGKPGRYGDLFVTLNVRLPTDLSPEEKKILDTLKNQMKTKV